MPTFAYLILMAGWVVWITPFFLLRKGTRTASQLDKRARWGVVIQALAFMLVFFRFFWISRPEGIRVALSVFFLCVGDILSWTSARTLGRQWRIDAGLNADHELIQTGAYRVIRHPIYASMLCMLLGAGFMLTRWPFFALSLVVFLVGIEIRVRVEDGLLLSRFGAKFLEYKRNVRAYIPMVR